MMKKIYSYILWAFTSMLCVSCATYVKVPSNAVIDPMLIGTWECSEHVNDDNGSGWAYDTYVFNADGSFSQNGSIDMTMDSDDMSFDMKISFEGAGNFGVADGRIYFDFSPSEANAELQRFNLKTSDNSLNADEQAKTMAVIKFILVTPMIKQMKKTMMDGQIYLLDSLDANSLIITNTKPEDPQPQTFKKIK